MYGYFDSVFSLSHELRATLSKIMEPLSRNDFAAIHCNTWLGIVLECQYEAVRYHKERINILCLSG